MEYKRFDAIGYGKIFVGGFSSGALFYGIKIKHSGGDGFISLGSAYEDEPNVPVLRYESALGPKDVLDLSESVEFQAELTTQSIVNLRYDECRGLFGILIKNDGGLYLSVYSSGGNYAINCEDGNLLNRPSEGYAFKAWKLVFTNHDTREAIVEYSQAKGLSFPFGVTATLS